MKAEGGSGKAEADKKGLSDFPDNSSSSGFPPSTFRLFICYWLPLITYCLFIFYYQAFHRRSNCRIVPLRQAVAHAARTGFSAFFFIEPTARSWPTAPVWTMTNASLLSTGVYGITDEIHQYFVPGRFADPWDLLADMVGALLGVIAYHVWLYLQSRRASSSFPVRLTKQAGLDKQNNFGAVFRTLI